MKTTYELDSADLKAAIEAWMLFRGTPVDDADTFTVDASGNVSIVCSNAPESNASAVAVAIKPVVQAPITSPTATSTVVVSPNAQISTTSPGHMVQCDPPQSVTGKATMFALNWDGSIDQSDNGIGFFTDPATGKPYDTRNKTLTGCSLPREVLLSTFLNINTWKTAGIDSIWGENDGKVQAYVTAHKPLVTIDSGGFSMQNVPLVDAGPSADTGNAIDLCYAVAHALNTNGDAVATYMVVINGEPVTIVGWDSATGKVG